MTRLFADTAFWIALADRTDQYANSARDFVLRANREGMVTTQFVLTEFLAYFSRPLGDTRTAAYEFIRRLEGSPAMTVVEASAAHYQAGVNLYGARPDKGYSLVDCISMNVMRDLGLTEALTSDRHFEQEGFQALLR